MRLAPTLMAVALMAVSLMATLAGRPAAADHFMTLKDMLAGKALELTALQRSHLKSLSAMASDARLTDYFYAADSKRPIRMPEVRRLLSEHDTGAELCLVDKRGNEHLRMVRGKMARDAELAHDEMDAPFFRPGIALKEGASHVSQPYFSPDVEEWVVGFVVPVVPGEAFLHFEYPLKDYERLLRTGEEYEGRYLLTLDPAGNIVADSRRGKLTSRPGPDKMLPSIAKGPSALPPEVVAAVLSGQPGEMRATVDGKPMGFTWVQLPGLVLVAFETVKP